MKVLYSSDLHGEIYLYQELFSLTLSCSPEIIALGGDLLPSFPPTKRYEDMIPNQKTFINKYLSPWFRRIIDTTSVKQIFLIPGNWDLGYSHLFKDSLDGLTDLTQGIYRLRDGYQFIGYPFVPPSPFRPKDYEKMDDPESPWPPQKNPSYIRTSDQCDGLTAIDPYLFLRSQETIQEDLDRLPKPLHPRRTILIMHSPPSGTRLDFIQGNKSVGSRSIKAFIEKNQPRLTLHGHIHEAPGLSGSYYDRIGKTMAINPGQFISTKLHAVTFEMENIEETLQHTCYPKVRSDEFACPP